MDRSQLKPRGTTIVLLLALALTAVAYVPGLNGIFFFDDFSNILENERLIHAPVSIEGAYRAAFSIDSGQLKRPVSLLSFWANIRLTGLNPFAFKLTNLFIHLINGLLIYALCIQLLAVYRKRFETQIDKTHARWIALSATGLWLLHPLNLTSVLYVVQRMNSLAALFTLAGLVCYVAGRQRLDSGKLAWPSLLMSFFPFGALALLSKEN